MPVYDFRCDHCQSQFSLTFKTVAAYDEAATFCPSCKSDSVSRVIKKVAIANTKRDYSKLSAGEMLSVLETGDAKQVDAMFKQVGGNSPSGALPSLEDLPTQGQDSALGEGKSLSKSAKSSSKVDKP